MASNPPIGTRAEFTQTVRHENTLSAVDGKMPAVLSSPWMIGWMEMACYLAQERFCSASETTVGTRIDVVHRAPCTVGAVVVATAELERVEGRFFIYKVEAVVRNGERPGIRLGWGHVHRAVVHVESFIEKT